MWGVLIGINNQDIVNFVVRLTLRKTLVIIVVGLFALVVSRFDPLRVFNYLGPMLSVSMY